MSMRFFILVLIEQLLIVKSILCLFDPFTIGITAGLGALGYNYKYLKDNVYCSYIECCIDPYIPADVNNLKSDLQANVFGQHIVEEQLIPALRAHYSNLGNSAKPLVMSFHGTPGTGKNYVADRIAKHIYKKGVNSQFVHKFFGRIDFPEVSKVELYRENLKEQIVYAMKKCPRSLFIFDEVEKMPAGVFESITSLLDHHPSVYGIDFRQSVFIFLTNAGGTEISDKLIKLMGNGYLREYTKMHEYEKICELAAYNIDGGLQKTAMIESSLIDHFIPFLPLEKRHVEKCIIEEFKIYGKTPTESQIHEVSTNAVTYYANIFSTMGCKRITKKVAVLVS